MLTFAHASRTSLALRGLAALAFGVLTLLWPGVTVFVLVVLWGAYALVDGLAILVDEFRRPTGTRRAVAFVEAVAGVAAGVITFFWPGITALALLWVIALWLLVTGVLEIAGALSRRPTARPHWLLGVLGALSIVAGVILIVAPVTGALAITWVIAWYAIISAFVLWAWAWQGPPDHGAAGHIVGGRGHVAAA